MKTFLKFINADVLFSMVFVLTLIGLLSQIPINTDLIDPISQALDETQITDVVYTAIRDTPQKDTLITLVNIGNLSRGEIADLINQLNTADPAIIAIDTRFLKDKSSIYKERGQIDQDSLLMLAFESTKTLVLVSDLQRDSNGVVQNIVTSHPKFLKNAHQGFANMITNADDFRVARKIVPKEVVQGDTVLFFPVKIVSLFNNAKSQKFLARNNELETIYYRGNINNFVSAHDAFDTTNIFHSLDWPEVMSGTFDKTLVKNKIILMGYMGEIIKNDIFWDEDKFFTPMNKNYAGKSFPDMYGVVVHANIISMILNEIYINEMSDTHTLIVNAILCFIATALFAAIYNYMHMWWDGVSVIAAIGLLIVSWATEVFIFFKFNYQINLDYSLIYLFLLGNLLELYYEYTKPFMIWALVKFKLKKI